MPYVGVNGRDHRDAMIKCVSAISAPMAAYGHPAGFGGFVFVAAISNTTRIAIRVVNINSVRIEN